MVLFLGYVLSSLGTQTPSQGVKYEGWTVEGVIIQIEPSVGGVSRDKGECREWME